MPTFAIACDIVKKLTNEGFTAYFAGGWVRDFLMHCTSDDIDIATNAPVEVIQKLFPKTIPVGISFGIIIVVEEGHPFEIATFRKERGYRDGRRPTTVEPATPEEDAERRDFTINGMFYDPIKQKVLDYIGGQKDLQKRIIRAIGNPHQRLLEDRLRMIRAVRYASRFRFSIEEETLKAIVDHAELLFPAVAMERVWKEFTKMAAFPRFDKALITLHRLDLLPIIFPSLKETPIEEIQKRVEILPYFPEGAPPIAKLLELFPSASMEEKIDLCSYLKLSNQDRAFVQFYHQLAKTINEKKELYEWAYLYADSFFPICLKILSTHFPIEERQALLQEHHMRQTVLKKAIDRIQRKDPCLKAKHLQEIGITPGKRMGELLKEGERIGINQSLDTPQEIIERLQIEEG